MPSIRPHRVRRQRKRRNRDHGYTTRRYNRSFRGIRAGMGGERVAGLISCLKLRQRDLPLLWDADSLLGPKDETGADT